MPTACAGRVVSVVEGLNIPIGVLPREDALIYYAIPEIFRAADPHHDGHYQPGQPIYSSFGFKDTHGMASSFTRWVDGWVYACHGFSNDSEVKGADGKAIKMNSGNTYRFKPDGSHIEQFTHGQVNPFGLAMDPLGNLYSSDCHTKPIYMLLRGVVSQLWQAARRAGLRARDDRALSWLYGHRRRGLLHGRSFSRVISRDGFHRQPSNGQDQPRPARAARLDVQGASSSRTSSVATIPGSGRSISSWGRTARSISPISTIASSAITKCR